MLSSWQVGAAQFADGRCVVTGYRDTSMAAAVAGLANSEVWLWDPRQRRVAQQLLLADEHRQTRDVSIDLILPGGAIYTLTPILRRVCTANTRSFLPSRVLLVDVGSFFGRAARGRRR